MYSVYSSMLKRTVGSRYEEGNKFLSHFRYAKLNQTNAKLKAFDDEFAHVTQYAQ